MTTASVTASTRRDPWSGNGNLHAEIHETHTGLVALIGERAFKTKKAIVTDFLDFSTRDRREQACQREVALNRRLAPDSYLGVGHFAAPGEPAEPVIVMRRYPESARLAALVRSGDPVDGHLTAIADRLARFHRTAQRGPSIDEQATAAAISERWHENLNELKRYVDKVIPEATLREVTLLADRYLAGREQLFVQRIASGRVVDGHGDLLTQDIFCMPDGPVLLDCLEFDDRLRYVDGVDDAAFLAMDLEFLGRKDLADRFLDEYLRRADDPAPRSLRDFSVAYRAVVRAKVDCIRVDQGDADAATDATRHLDIALAHLKSCTVRLVVVGGGPGTGKTTVAHGLAERVNARVISTDEVRRELQRSGAIAGRVGELDVGLYAPENVSAVYDEVLRRARALLSAGETVVLDGTWRDAQQQERAYRLAAETCSAVVHFVCSLSPSQAAERVVARGPSSSDATPQIAVALGENAGTGRVHRIDTARPLADSVNEASRVVRRAVGKVSRTALDVTTPTGPRSLYGSSATRNIGLDGWW
ncbi:AAA family ATPase [Mycobacterium sp. GA-1285]|uniref:bifunctional aminoglycoside phosphotransferase/ATP-binding protein n=1 Tax=Mycobacterium sp. GA-1285 TaxID=1772282 RepID=UPI0009E7F5C1|nr:AAA family ATPase [Mycobacterium sp. GA-1285]